MLWAAGIVMGLAAAGEVVARFVFGLADPPLYVADPEIEYLNQPNQECSYLRNRIAYNEWSMRSEPLDRTKQDPNEFRVLVVGDSVVAGGVKIDQAELATELLKGLLEHQLNRRVVVGNVAAGGWGPPNQLAYLRRFGFFDADCVVLLLSSGDYGDAPGDQSKLGADHAFPVEKPWSALVALGERGISSTGRNARHAERLSQERPADRDDVTRAMTALSEMLDLARENVPLVYAAIHLQRREAEGDLQPGHLEIRDALTGKGVPVIELGPAFKEALRSGQEPYFDWIHPSPLGQQLIARTLAGEISKVVLDVHGDN
jgi:hypothetical protein